MAAAERARGACVVETHEDGLAALARGRGGGGAGGGSGVDDVLVGGTSVGLVLAGRREDEVLQERERDLEQLIEEGGTAGAATVEGRREYRMRREDRMRRINEGEGVVAEVRCSFTIRDHL